MAVQEINNSPDLLPYTKIRFAIKDSACNKGNALVSAHELARTSFNRSGADAVIGAACSDASVSAADYLTQLQIPQLSPSSTGYALSDGEAYPFFARTPPSDAWQNFALADVVEHLVKAERVATVNSEDAYGTASLQAFKDEANQRNLRVLASTSFAIGQTNFSSNLDALNRSGALVVVLFCPVADASRFISATQAAGLDDIVWVGSESVTLAVRNMVTGSSDQASRLRGFAGIGPSGAAGAAYTAFQSRLNAFQATVLGYGYCTAETDDDGRYLWAAEVPAWVAAVQPPPTVSSCLWASGDITNDFYAAFAYDAVYAMAYAIERTLAVAPFAPLDGTALMGQLLDTTFLGATGLVAFDKNGDRAAGISYEVFNVANMPTLPTMPMVGRWQQGTTWSSRFTSTWSSRFTSSASYVAADGRSSRATDFAGSNMLLPLAVMCENATAGSKRQREECDHIQHAVDRLNDKTDGWYDGLLPDYTIVTAMRSVGCVEGRARSAWLELEESLPSFAAVIGPTCSKDVADVAGQEWRGLTSGSRAVVISPGSTTPELKNEAAYPNVARAAGTDEQMAQAFTKLGETFGWDRVAILHDDSMWGAGAAWAFKTAFKGEVIKTVGFDLSAFDAGAANSGLGGPTVYAHELLARLAAALPRVIVLATQPRVQRSLFAWSYDHGILSGPGYGWMTFSKNLDDLFHNEDGSVNTSAIKGAEGLLGLRPRALLGAPWVVKPMVDLWRARSHYNCHGTKYCDSDGCPGSWTEYSPTTVDAVLMYAHAMDYLSRYAPLSMGDPDALYAAILDLPAFQGLTGPIQVGVDGDLLARFTLVNLQVSIGVADSSCELRQRRQLGLSVDLLKTSATFVEVGEYDSFTKLLTVSNGSIVFSQGASTVPVTSVCDGKVPGREYYTHVQTECSGQVGPTLSFEWAKPPPDHTCVLPVNVTLGECPLSYPWSTLWVILLVVLAPLPVVLLLIPVSVIAYKDFSKDVSKIRDLRTKPVMGFLRYLGERKGGILAYQLLWLGVLAHAVAVPVLFADAESGEVTEEACIARSIIVIVASTLVFLGITVRVGEVMEAEESRYNYKPWARQRWAFAIIAVLVFSSVIASLVIVLGYFTESIPAMVNRTEPHVIMVADNNFQELHLPATRCRSAADTELTSLQFILIYYPWGVLHVLGLVIHSARITRSRRLLVHRGHLSLHPTFFTLLLHCVVSLIMMLHGSAQAQTFAIRAPIGVLLGWLTLLTEVALPAYHQYVRKSNDAMLFVVPRAGTEGEALRIPRLKELRDTQAGKKHHLYISYKWNTSYDKVQTLYEKLRRMIDSRGEKLKIWLDTVELQKSELRTGKVGAQSVEQSVKNSLALLVFLTTDYLTSEFSQTELRIAYETGIPIIIVCEELDKPNGVSEATLEYEIQQFKVAQEQELEAEDQVTLQTLRAMENLKERVMVQWDIELKRQEGISMDDTEAKIPDDGIAVLWWSDEFLRVALKGVVHQLLVAVCECKPEMFGTHGHASQKCMQAQIHRSLILSQAADRLVFQDELRFLRKSLALKRQVTLFVSPDYPRERKDELTRAFEEAGRNLGVDLTISSTPGETSTSVLLLHPAKGAIPGFFATHGLRILTKTINETPAFLFYSTDDMSDLSEQRKHGVDALGEEFTPEEFTRVFTPTWSPWPQVASLKVAAAELKLKQLVIGTPETGGLSGKIAQLKLHRSTGKIEVPQATIATGSALLRPVSPMKVSVSPMRIMPPSSPRPLTPRRAINAEDAQVLDFDG